MMRGQLCKQPGAKACSPLEIYGRGTEGAW